MRRGTAWALALGSLVAWSGGLWAGEEGDVEEPKKEEQPAPKKVGPMAVRPAKVTPMKKGPTALKPGAAKPGEEPMDECCQGAAGTARETPGEVVSCEKCKQFHVAWTTPKGVVRSMHTRCEACAQATAKVGKRAMCEKCAAGEADEAARKLKSAEKNPDTDASTDAVQ